MAVLPPPIWSWICAEVRPEFAPIADNPDLPRVLLIGDSISIGYTLPVRELLRGKANVHRPAENCGPTTRGLERIDVWLGAGGWDVIHFNFGLHDLKMDEQGRHQVALDVYEENLEQIVARLERTRAELIWASTTPVPEDVEGPFRDPRDVLRYNAAAAAVMHAHGIAIDDLYSFALPQLGVIQRPHDVHFTPGGSAVLARQVVASIEAALAPTS
ncbi:MAG: SGNH/GDSL hydrolase family protein [Armatimonadota bacterium]